MSRVISLPSSTILKWKGLPRLVVPRMVPPRGRMPLTSFSVSSNDFSGQIRPSKPSGMPITFHPYLRMAALVAARMTALRPGASPPPVAIPMQRISDIGNVGTGRFSSAFGGVRKLGIFCQRLRPAFDDGVATIITSRGGRTATVPMDVEGLLGERGPRPTQNCLRVMLKLDEASLMGD